MSIACFLALTATALTGCPGGDEGVVCASGRICPSGCAADQDVCIDDTCGDGLVDADAGEECDDGNIIDGDGCAAACTREPFCGDGNMDPGEECDDGNALPGDGCAADCREEVIECGNGLLQTGEECDDGNDINGDGCSNDCRDENFACPAPADRVHQYTYVVSDMILPQNVAEAVTLSLDIDFRAPIRNDNTLGQVMAALGQQVGVDYNTMQQGAVRRGDTLLLASVQTIDTENSLCATTGLYPGENPSDPPCAGPGDTVCGGHLGGATSFDVAAPGSPMNGAIIANRFSMSPADAPGNVTIELQLSNTGPATRLDLFGARVELGTITADGLQSGILGGALTEAAVQDQFLPGMHVLIAEAIAADCTGGSPPCCTPGSYGETMIGLFDEDMDCQVTVDEVRNNDLIGALLAPDLDLLDANGDFNPDGDGVDDSLSFGMGISAVGGQFTIPASSP